MADHFQTNAVEWQSEDPVLDVQWSSSGTLLAVVTKPNRLTILNERGIVMYSKPFPFHISKTLTAFTWAHNDQVIVAAAGTFSYF